MNIKRDIQNNVFIIKCIYHAGKVVLGISLFSILLDCIWTYVGTNLGLWVFDSINRVSMKRVIMLVVITLSILIVFEMLLVWFRNLIIPVAKTRISEYMTNALIKKVFEIYQGDVEDESFFNIYSRAITEINVRPGKVLAMCRDIVCGFIQLIVLLVISTKLNLFITLFFGVASIIGAVITVFINKQEYLHYKASTKSNRQLSYINRVIYQPEYGRLLRMNWGLRTLLTKKNSEFAGDIRELIKEYGVKIASLKMLNTIICLISFEIFPWVFVIYGLYNGTMTFGEVTVIMSFADRLPDVFSSIFGSLATFRKESLYIENLREVLEYEVEKKPMGNAVESEEGVLETADQISFTYDSKKGLIIKGASLSLREGELTAFVGPNGAGKTTLACLLAGLYMASDGHVYFKGQDLNGIPLKQLSEKIIMIAQDSILLSVSVIENILQRSPQCLADYELAENALKKVGMYDKIKSLPKGIDTIVTKEFDSNGVVFSGGERQKITLSRVYASDAKLIILDEPTSALDAFSEKEIIDIMRQLAQTKTMVVISHRLSMVACADRILYIDDGKIVEEGTHVTLLQKKGKYYELFKTQAEKYKMYKETGDK